MEIEYFKTFYGITFSETDRVTYGRGGSWKKIGIWIGKFAGADSGFKVPMERFFGSFVQGRV